MREPLLHFVVLGAVLFGVDHLLASRDGDPQVIVVDADVDAHAIEVFKEARGREPNSDELYALRKVWLDNEVLYREGIALGLDKGDNAIRERVIFKALSMVDAGVKLPAIDESDAARVVRESIAQKYDEPARFDFEEAVIAGDRSEAVARAFARALNAGSSGRSASGSARVHRPPARQHRAELRRGVRRGARGGAARRMAGAAEPRRLARHAAESDDAGQAREVRRSRRRGAAGLDGRGDVGTTQRRRARAGAQVHRESRRARKNERADARSSRCCCSRSRRTTSQRARDDDGRDGAARNAARRIPVAVGRERQPSDRR